MRIDAATKDDHEQLKQEIRDEIRRDALRRRALGCGCSLFFFLLFTFAPITYVAAQLAKTGFVRVPLLTSHLFRPSTPTRTVLPLAGSTPDDIAKAVAAGTSVNPQTGTASVRIDESQLTTLVNDALVHAPDGMLPFEVTSAQVAIDASAMELFVVTPQEPGNSTIKARFVPEVKRGAFAGDVQSLEVGSYTAPDRLADTLFSAFGSYVLSSVQSSIERAGTLQEIRLEDRHVTFVIHLNSR